jgi:hypothetical protein
MKFSWPCEEYLASDDGLKSVYAKVHEKFVYGWAQFKAQEIGVSQNETENAIFFFGHHMGALYGKQHYKGLWGTKLAGKTGVFFILNEFDDQTTDNACVHFFKRQNPATDEEYMSRCFKDPRDDFNLQRMLYNLIKLKKFSYCSRQRSHYQRCYILLPYQSRHCIFVFEPGPDSNYTAKRH